MLSNKSKEETFFGWDKILCKRSLETLFIAVVKRFQNLPSQYESNELVFSVFGRDPIDLPPDFRLFFYGIQRKRFSGVQMKDLSRNAELLLHCNENVTLLLIHFLDQINSFTKEFEHPWFGEEPSIFSNVQFLAIGQVLRAKFH